MRNHQSLNDRDADRARHRTSGCRRAGVLLAVLGISAIAAGLWVSPASARQIHPYIRSINFPFGDSNGTAGARGIAVNEATHHIYAIESRGQSHAIIYNLEPSGSADPVDPSLTGAASLEAASVTVDNSGDPFAGYIYVGDRGGALSDPVGMVQQFDPSGTATAVTIKAAAIPTDGTAQAGGLPAVVNDGMFSPEAVAIAPTGNLLVVDGSNRVIDEFSPDGTFLAQLGSGQIIGGGISLAVSPDGSLYVGGPTFGLIKLDSAGECANACQPMTTNPVEGLAADSAGNVLASVSEALEGGASQVAKIEEFNPDGVLTSESGVGDINTAGSVAFDGAAGDVYNVDANGFPSPVKSGRSIEVFGPLITLPDAATAPAEEVNATTARLAGTVSAAGGPSAECRFEYVAASGFATSGFAGAQSTPCLPGGPFDGVATVAVQANPTGLIGGTEYRFRILATNENGNTPGAALRFETAGPSISEESFNQTQETSTTVTALINPNGASTTYVAEYQTKASFEQNGFTEAVAVPLGGAELAAGPVQVSVPLSGLLPGTAYLFRFRAESTEAGAPEPDVTLGPAVGFVTFAPRGTSLPDGRRYEQVSPIDKNGNNIQGELNAVQASTNGDRVTYYVNGGIPGGTGAQGFPSYLSTRAVDSSGWSTQGVLPPAETGISGKVLGWDEELSKFYVANKRREGPATLYSRSSDGGSLTQLAAGGLEREPFFLADATQGGASAVFESTAPLEIAGAAGAGKPNVYLWSRTLDEPVLAGVLNTDRAPTKGAFAGPYDWFFGQEPTAPGGAQARYYTEAEHVLSSDGSRVFFTAAGTGQIYVRLNPTEPQSAIVGGKCTEPDLACTLELTKPELGVVAESKPAAFLGATPDGESAFFLSKARLTHGATSSVGVGYDLYRYDIGSGKLTDLTVDTEGAGASVQGVLGWSDDGSTVYFVANGVLPGSGAPSVGSCSIGAPSGTCNLYLERNGSVVFISKLAGAESINGRSDFVDWTPSSEPRAGNAANAARVSPDGDSATFRSQLQLGSYENHGYAEIYRYGVDGAGLNCISCNPTRQAPSGSASVQALPEPLTGPKLRFGVKNRNLSMNGDRIFFDSPDPLVAADSNGVNDVYEWEAPDSGLQSDTCTIQSPSFLPESQGCLFLISSGTSAAPSYFLDASADGDDIFFFTEQSLVSQDRDALVDIYDARVGGGIQAQEEDPLAPCLGEACAGAPSTSPSIVRPGSVGLAVSPPLAPKCRRGFRRAVKHGRKTCVKRVHTNHRHRRGRKHPHNRPNRKLRHRHSEKGDGKR